MKEGSSPYQYKILVVDDEPDILLTFKIVLEENGFKTDAFNDPILALRNFTAGSYEYKQDNVIVILYLSLKLSLVRLISILLDIVVPTSR